MTPSAPSRVREGLLLFAVVFGPLAFGATEPWSRAVLQAVLFLLLAACVLRGSPRVDNPVRETLLPALLLLLLLGVFQRLNPRGPGDPASLFPSTGSARATQRELLLWASYASLLWCAPQVLAARGAARRFAWTLFLLGAFVAVVGIVQRGQGNAAYYGLRPVRHGEPFGPYVNRDHAASLMVMSALTGAGLFLSRWVGFRARGGKARADVIASQAATLFLLGVVLFGVVSSRSRGAVNSLLLALWLTGLLATGFVGGRGLRWGARTVLALGVPGYCAFLWFHPLWIGSILQTPDLSTAYRLSIYRGGLTLLRDFPAWGAGLGALRDVYPAYQERFVVGVVDHVHGDWLELALELGVAGAAVAVAGVGAYLGRSLRSWRNAPSRSARCLAGGALAGVLAFLLHEGVDFSFHVPANAVVFLTVACSLGGLTAPGAESRVLGG